MKPNQVLGHEFMGKVKEVGPECHLKVGQRVVVSFQIACGQCEFCKRGLSSMCERTNTSSLQETMYGKGFAGLFGYTNFAGGYDGGQAEQVRVPYADVNCLPIPDSIPDEKALFLSDIIPTAEGAVNRADVKKGSTVAIWGLGPIGLLACQWSLKYGASKIYAIDCVPERLHLAQKKYGAIPINFKEVKDVVEELYKHEKLGIDCCIDAAAFRYTPSSTLHTIQRAVGLETDQPTIVNEAIRACKKFGNISLVADYAGITNGFMIGAVMEKGITLRGTGQTPVHMYWKRELEMLEKGEFKVEDILSHRFSIDEFEELYEKFDKKEYGLAKVFVETKFSSPPAPGTPQLSSFRAGKVLPSAVA